MNHLGDSGGQCRVVPPKSTNALQPPPPCVEIPVFQGLHGNSWCSFSDRCVIHSLFSLCAGKELLAFDKLHAAAGFTDALAWEAGLGLAEPCARKVPLSPIEPTINRHGGDALEGHCSQKKTPPPKDPTVGLCLGSYGGPRGSGVSYGRGTPVSPAETQPRRGGIRGGPIGSSKCHHAWRPCWYPSSGE